MREAVCVSTDFTSCHHHRHHLCRAQQKSMIVIVIVVIIVTIIGLGLGKLSQAGLRDLARRQVHARVKRVCHEKRKKSKK